MRALLRSKNLMAVIIAGVMAIITPQLALALTAANTTISNRATVDYKVGGASQTVIRSSPTGNSTPGAANGSDTTFVVDDKVIFTITSDTGANVDTAPGAASQQAMKFTITNTGNLVHDFAFTADVRNDGTTGGSTVSLFEDSNGNGVYDPGVDKAAGAAGASYLLLSGGTAYIDELAVGASKVVFVAINIPATAASGQTVQVYLTGTAHNTLAEVRTAAAAPPILAVTSGSLGGLTVANAGSGDTASLLDIVLAEAAGDGTDNANDGTLVRYSTNNFTVRTVTLTVQKTSAVVWDPVSLLVNPKAIPGAYVEYTIRVTYTAGVINATSIAISDNVPTNTLAIVDQYAATGEVQRIEYDVTGTVTTTTNLANGVDAALTNWGTAAGSLIKVNCASTFNEVGDYCEIKYRVEIQ